MKKLIFAMFAFFWVVAGSALAKTEYVYRNRMNWVKIEDLSKKQMGGVELKHPAIFSEPQMTAMLMSLEINKGQLFKEELKTTQIFEDEEARKLSGFIVAALAQAAPNQVVSVEVVHKKTQVILRNDYVSLFKVFVSDDGVHFYFDKLYAKLTGDYTQPANYDKAVQRAKSVRVTLNAKDGQTLVYDDANEIILNPTYNFAATDSVPVPSSGAAKVQTANPVQTQAASVPVEQLSVDERLQKLEELKTQGLITDKEYKTKRKEILEDL